jgi:nitrite reductase/ring-hydroxylating ferredoxin subunit
VYDEQIGVDHTIGPQFPQDFTPVMADSDLAKGQMQRVTVNGARILLTRHEGRVHAMAEVFSHLGGPLSEGRLNGIEVACPWHGSCFSLEDGSVIHGPATHPQPILETRIQKGQIEVRSSVS